MIGAGDIVASKKPAPDIYHWVLDRLALPASACLAIEDSENGLRAALAAGLNCLVTVSEYTRGQEFSGAAAVLGDLADLSLSRALQLTAKAGGRSWLAQALDRIHPLIGQLQQGFDFTTVIGKLSRTDAGVQLVDPILEMEGGLQSRLDAPDGGIDAVRQIDRAEDHRKFVTAQAGHGIGCPRTGFAALGKSLDQRIAGRDPEQSLTVFRPSMSIIRTAPLFFQSNDA